jgi:hypothetical protein
MLFKYTSLLDFATEAQLYPYRLQFYFQLDPDELKKQLAQIKEHLTKMERKAGISLEDDPEEFWKLHSEQVAKTIHEVLEEGIYSS